MKPWIRDFLTGLTAIVGIAGLVAMLFLFGELRGLGQEMYTFTLRMDTARGLAPVSPVTLNGVLVGNVTDITTLPDPTNGVAVSVRVLEKVRVPREFRVFIDQSFIGESKLELSPDPAQDLSGPDAFVRPGEVIARNAVGTIEQITERLEKPLSELSRSADDFHELATTYTEVGRRINTLLEPRTPEEVDAGADATVPASLARLDRALAGAETWLTDETLREDVRSTMERANTVLTEAAATAEAWREAARNVNELTGAAREQLRTSTIRLVSTLQAAEGALAELKQLAGSINAGEGTAGLLLTNPDLYRSLSDAAERLDRVLTEAQLTIEKFRKEGVPIQY